MDSLPLELVPFGGTSEPITVTLRASGGDSADMSAPAGAGKRAPVKHDALRVAEGGDSGGAGAGAGAGGGGGGGGRAPPGVAAAPPRLSARQAAPKKKARASQAPGAPDSALRGDARNAPQRNGAGTRATAAPGSRATAASAPSTFDESWIGWPKLETEDDRQRLIASFMRLLQKPAYQPHVKAMAPVAQMLATQLASGGYIDMDTPGLDAAIHAMADLAVAHARGLAAQAAFQAFIDGTSLPREGGIKPAHASVADNTIE